ncbi:hypothetical protein V3C99_009299, partial [Haemonchus contortus]
QCMQERLWLMLNLDRPINRQYQTSTNPQYTLRPCFTIYASFVRLQKTEIKAWKPLYATWEASTRSTSRQ